MPPNPNNVEATITLSEDYHDDKATIDFYTNSAIDIGRNRENPEEGVWLDSNEKYQLLEALKEHLED